jgi:hypothetical protein
MMHGKLSVIQMGSSCHGQGEKGFCSFYSPLYGLSEFLPAHTVTKIRYGVDGMVIHRLYGVTRIVPNIVGTVSSPTTTNVSQDLGRGFAEPGNVLSAVTETSTMKKQ